MKYFWTITIFILLALFLSSISAEQCGKQAGNALCPNGLCCSQYGFCGSTPEYCTNCQSQCGGGGGSKPTPSGGGGGVSAIITEAAFNQMLKYRNDGRCASNGFYTYSAFINAANSFSGFGTTGNTEQQKRELAAFLAQTSHETTGTFVYLTSSFIYLWCYIFRSHLYILQVQLIYVLYKLLPYWRMTYV